MTQNPFDISTEPISQRVIVGLNKISLALKSHAWQDAGQKKLTPTQSQILALLRSKPESGMRLSEVAEGLGVTPATASDAVSTLVEKGLVQKNRAAEDARAIAITLTDKGWQQGDSAGIWPNLLLTAVDELSELEQTVFLRGLIKMIRALQERGQISVTHMCVTCHFFCPNVYPNSKYPHHCALVNAPFSDHHLRLECPEHRVAEPQVAEQNWQKFISQEVN
ncbi:MAG: MarR family winged helix-turn-helix transcriptional regulator [Hassallia sp. WJT32-NPBG1]|jgi:DNA-binding MarR family transcriptional regulator|nr:MarR family winged helix-turn-helix transcriptional regulator [Spirirestis rafaelensis WJT71-NPBG6]MBW4607797.1 MarR family winged helix-turn-helix transcriptional regulator [Hassallia sp. WJT32-NPBG1]